MPGIADLYSRRRAQGRAAREKRRQAAFDAIPRLEPLCGQIDAARVKLGLVKARGEDCAAAQQALAELLDEQRALLQANGLPPDALEHRYVCERCRDTGLLPDGSDCPCAAKERFAATAFSSNLARFGQETFESWDLARFPEGEQRQASEKLRGICKEYAGAFPHCDPPGLMLRGGTGLGKSFAAHAVGNALLARGVGVQKITAYQFFRLISDRVVGARDRAPFENLLAAGLLIFDDLGAEPEAGNLSAEYFYLLLDERTMAGRPMIVTTNNEPQALLERYGDRTLSRLLDPRAFRQIRLRGKDLRRLR